MQENFRDNVAKPIFFFGVRGNKLRIRFRNTQEDKTKWWRRQTISVSMKQKSKYKINFHFKISVM